MKQVFPVGAIFVPATLLLSVQNDQFFSSHLPSSHTYLSVSKVTHRGETHFMRTLTNLMARWIVCPRCKIQTLSDIDFLVIGPGQFSQRRWFAGIFEIVIKSRSCGVGKVSVSETWLKGWPSYNLSSEFMNAIWSIKLLLADVLCYYTCMAVSNVSITEFSTDAIVWAHRYESVWPIVGPHLSWAFNSISLTKAELFSVSIW